ncbi:MAG: hypothetical protein V3S82_00645 [Dehalococcoidia bacterium]
MKGEQGLALMMALIALFLVAIICGALFSQVSAGLTSTQVGEGLVVERYSAGAGVEHALWRLVYDPGFAGSLTPGSPSVEYTQDINGQTVNITVAQMNSGSGPEDPVAVALVVTPDSASVGVETTFTYTMTIRNMSAESEEIISIGDYLPPGFSYVPGSSGGIATDDPFISIGPDGGERLRWSLSPFVSVTSGEERDQTFDAVATLAGGTHVTEGWANITGNPKVYSGATAPVVAASTWAGLDIQKTVTPDSTSIGRETTFTYTIYIENVDSVPVDLYQIEDLLPLDFNYVPGSSTGVTTADPDITVALGDNERLTWELAPSIPFSPGESRQQVFQATATLDEGTYWNTAWVYYLIGVEDLSSFTSPTAPVQAYSQYDIMAKAGRLTVLVAATVNQGTVTIFSWQVE